MLLDGQEPSETKNFVGYYQRHGTWERPGGTYHAFGAIKAGELSLPPIHTPACLDVTIA